MTLSKELTIDVSGFFFNSLVVASHLLPLAPWLPELLWEDRGFTFNPVAADTTF